MALEVTRKVGFVGVWLEDVLSDELLNTVASHAKADKGKAVKITLSSIGLRVKRTKIFQDSVAEFYPLANIRTVMRNPRMQSCILFMIADSRKKYKIIVFRCNSDGESIHMHRIFQQLQHDVKTPDVEMRKKVEGGNWTLANRTSHNASRHLAEVFNEQTMLQKEKSNGDVRLEPNHVQVSETTTTTDASAVLQTSYSRQNSTSSNIYDTPVIDRKDDDQYVIETEVEPYPASKINRSDLLNNSIDFSDSRSNAASEVEIAEFKADISNLTEEVKGLKTMIANMSVGDSVSMSNGSEYSSHTRYVNGRNGHASHEPVYAQPVVVRRGSAKTYGANMMVSKRSYAGDPWASHKRLSQASHAVMKPSKAYQMNSARRESDTGSVKSFSVDSQRGMNYRVAPRSVHGRSTVERPIEQTYAKHVVLTRPGTAPAVVHHHQIHTIGRKKKEFKVMRSKDMDLRF